MLSLYCHTPMISQENQMLHLKNSANPHLDRYHPTATPIKHKITLSRKIQFFI